MKILLVAYDNDSHISFFPLGIAYIAAACRRERHDVEIYNQDVYHWTEDHLLDFLNRRVFDVIGVGISGGYYQYRKLLKLADAINRSKNRPLFIIGGHGPSPEPEYFLKKTGADVAVISEGEQTIVNLLDVIAGGGTLDNVAGIAFMRDSECVRTHNRDLIENVDDIPIPAWDLFPMDHYTLTRKANIQNKERYMVVLSGRGCPFKCNFCYRLMKGFRPRSPESIIEEIRALQKNYAVTYIDFQDELLMSSLDRIELLCDSFLQADLKFKWACNGRLNFAAIRALKLMKRAGCVFINYGIESLDEKALQLMNKSLTVHQITEGIENTLAAGISPGFNIIFGNKGETAESLELGVQFLLKYDDHAQMRTIRPVTPYPGSPLYYEAIERGLLRDCEDFYESKHRNSDLLSVNFTELSDQKVHHLLYEANRRLLNSYYEHQKMLIVDSMNKLYIEGNADFRGFRHT